ncbi:hypothetical protein ACFY00_33330 [Kitasatospora sp. NPDC001540]|uniref:hypothetical protein n=1 Tax=Kitasatospora sp. NPDC001540 TaxID=3364014 RepID=UPI003697A4B0
MPPRPRHPRTLLAYAALLDHSIDRIAELTADARQSDPEEVHRLANVWDNNTFGLFSAATAPTRWARGRRARAALRWMADCGADRRAWVAGRTAAAGFPVEHFLLPAGREVQHIRDHRGTIDHFMGDLTPEYADGLAAEYDLAAAEVDSLRLEAYGPAAVRGTVRLRLPRRFPDDGRARRPFGQLSVDVEAVTAARFDSTDTRGAAIDFADDGGLRLRFGRSGLLGGPGATRRLEDECWHLSPTGRRYVAAHPPEDDPPVTRLRSNGNPTPSGEAHTTASVLHRVMLAVRCTRFHASAGRVPVHHLATALTGAGTRVLDAGVRRGAARERAFRALADDWRRRGGRQFDEAFRDLYDADPSPLPVPARLRLVSYRAAATDSDFDPSAPATLSLHLAQPPAPGAPWVLRSLDLNAPGPLRLTLDDFHRTAVPDLAPGRLAFGPGLTATGAPEPA